MQNCECGRQSIQHNNVLLGPVCATCVSKRFNAQELKEFAVFCRTFNIYWNPNLYLRLQKQNMSSSELILAYINNLYNDNTDYIDNTKDWWEALSKEWATITKHTHLISKVAPIREGFVERAQLKWGRNFNFEEYVMLENLFINTIKAYNITDPIRSDSIKKACKTSVMIDRLIEENAAKDIKEFTNAYQNFLKIAKIDELGEMAMEGTIKTVSDLYKYMEDNGFTFKFYDKQERDEIDYAINDIKQAIRSEIVSATGLELTLETIKQKYFDSLEEQKTLDVLQTDPIENYDDEFDVVAARIDAEYAAQSIDEGVIYD